MNRAEPSAAGRGVATTLTISLCLLAAVSFAGGPAWWQERGVLQAGASTNDWAPVNLGQAKQMAAQAYAEMEDRWPGGAGAAASNLVFAFGTSNNYLAVNLGQLKTLYRPFYDRLVAEGYTNAPGWTATAADDADYAPANIGQLKHLFGFDFDTDADGLPDWWELQAFGDLDESGAGDPDGDGFTNLQEYEAGADPNYFDPLPVVTIRSPRNGSILP